MAKNYGSSPTIECGQTHKEWNVTDILTHVHKDWDATFVEEEVLSYLALRFSQISLSTSGPGQPLFHEQASTTGCYRDLRDKSRKGTHEDRQTYARDA